MINVFILCFTGLLLSLYALYIDKKRPETPLCDISRNISCSKAINSKYGKLLGFPNSIMGLIFYPSFMLSAHLQVTQILQLIGALGFIATVVLAYFSYIKMKNFCLICTATYIINVILFLIVA